MKKLLALLLSSVMALSMVACGSKDAPAADDASTAGKGKVAIITGTASQGEEEIRAAENMKEKYGDRVVTATYPDNFTKEIETVISNVVGLVSDPDVKALVFCQAVPGAAAAIEKAKEIKPDLLVIAGVPGEGPEVIASAADIVLSADEIDGMGNVIPEQAQKLGAKTFIHYSFPRHMSIPTLSARRDLFRENCAKLGMEFVEVNAPDPTSDAGVAGAQQFILEDVPKQVAKYGADTAFFSTNCAMQEPLIKAVIDQKAIYPQPCCPSPFHGFPNALGLNAAESEKEMIDAVTAKVAELGVTGRLSTWPVQINRVEVEAGTDYAMRWIDGEFTEKVNFDEIKKSCETVAGAAMTLSNLVESGNTYENYVTLLCEFVTF
ncbi:MAG: DUF3798 domain-containing protein [Oscillospiraceae bacterium]